MPLFSVSPSSFGHPSLLASRRYSNEHNHHRILVHSPSVYHRLNTPRLCCFVVFQYKLTFSHDFHGLDLSLDDGFYHHQDSTMNFWHLPPFWFSSISVNVLKLRSLRIHLPRLCRYLVSSSRVQRASAHRRDDAPMLHQYKPTCSLCVASQYCNTAQRSLILAFRLSHAGNCSRRGRGNPASPGEAASCVQTRVYLLSD